MTYCSNCGAKIELGILYCSNCGSRAEIPVQPSPQPEKYEEIPQNTSNNGRLNRSTRHEQIRKHKAGKIIALVIIVLMICSGVSFLASSVQYEIQADRTYTYESEKIPVDLTFKFDVSSAEIVYQFNSSPIDDIIKIEANFDFEVRGIEELSLEEFYDIVWETSNFKWCSIYKFFLFPFGKFFKFFNMLPCSNFSQINNFLFTVKIII